MSKLYLVGAGPGDPELLTIKALRVLNEVDVILYDALVNPKVFDSLDSKPELIFVGKRRGESFKQAQINEQILLHLAQGKNVARLKGGDPMFLARGVEELQLAHEHNYEFEVIPGLTSGLSVSGLNAIALTFRGKSDSVLMTTGHEISQAKFRQWQEVLKLGQTLVIYMGVGKIVEISQNLSAALDAKTPVIVLANGSLENELILRADLETVAQAIIDNGIQSPALILVGKHIDQGFLDKQSHKTLEKKRSLASQEGGTLKLNYEYRTR